MDSFKKSERRLVESAENAKTNRKKKNYYKILGVKKTATKKEIVKAYRKAAQRGIRIISRRETRRKKPKKMFIDIAAAKEVLNNEEKRKNSTWR
ncbi:hypothetical protein LSTR_LSTR016607 [Laodelphax striatellus]|uniref:J domain-containing protein n=1 Tax=Laodelphax striatellus TaxID=195883 RepID=A0A482WX78_LAOST|nr:hypothetical protein LSTR_LSTR016607 [Laodelphax striatellus]